MPSAIEISAIGSLSRVTTLILLFSGYLYVVNRILDMEALTGMIGRFREQGRQMATSDPSIGLMAQADDGTFNPKHPARDFLRRHSREVAELLGDMTHIYLTPGVETPKKHVSFFNPNIVLEPEALAGADQRLRVGFTRDVSGSGLCLRTEQPEPIGALVRLMLRGVDGEPEPDALARVAWSYPSDGGSHC